jgi:hypothetical protein
VGQASCLPHQFTVAVYVFRAQDLNKDLRNQFTRSKCSLGNDLKTRVSPMFHVEHQAEQLWQGIRVATYPREFLRMERLGLTEVRARQGQQALQQEQGHSTEELIHFSQEPVRPRGPEKAAPMESREPEAPIARSLWNALVPPEPCPRSMSE